MPRFALLVLTGLLALGGALPARALTTVARDFDQLVTRADTVFKGTVSAKTSRRTGEGADRHIVTLVTFQVEETYKGTAAPFQTLRFLGGTVGAETMEVPDLPRFEVGQKAVLFVVGNGKQFCPLVGVAQGRFQVVRDEATGRERVFTNEGSPVVSTSEIGKLDEAGGLRLRGDVQAAAPAMTTEDFRSEIAGKVAALRH